MVPLRFQRRSIYFNYAVTRLNISTFSWEFNCFIQIQWISSYFNKRILICFNSNTFQCISTHLFQQYFIEFNKRNIVFHRRISFLFQHPYFNEFHQRYFNSIITQFENCFNAKQFQHTDFNLISTPWFTDAIEGTDGIATDFEKSTFDQGGKNRLNSLAISC